MERNKYIMNITSWFDRTYNRIFNYSRCTRMYKKRPSPFKYNEIISMSTEDGWFGFGRHLGKNWFKFLK